MNVVCGSRLLVIYIYKINVVSHLNRILVDLNFQFKEMNLCKRIILK